MLRAVVVSGTTVVGIGAVLALNPTGQTSAALKVATVKPVANEGGVVFGPNVPAGGSAGVTPSTRTPSTGPTPSRSATQPVSHASAHASASRAPRASQTPTSSHAAAPASGTATVTPPPTSQAATPTPSPSAPTSATAVGQPVDVGYGIVQVQATVSGGRLVRIDPVQLPDASPYSANLNSQAWPLLVQEALQAQSSQIAGVTNATYTSEGFAMSLRSALVALGHAG